MDFILRSNGECRKILGSLSNSDPVFFKEIDRAEDAIEVLIKKCREITNPLVLLKLAELSKILREFNPQSKKWRSAGIPVDPR